MDKVFEITRVYTTQVMAADEAAAKKLERVTFEYYDPQIIVKQVAAKLSPEQVAKIVEAAE